MSAAVPWKRTNPRYQEVLVGAPVRGRLWQDTARLGHWTRAHGMQIIPGHYLGHTLAPSGSITLRWHVEPGPLAIARVWTVTLRAETPAGQRATITWPDAGSTVAFPPDGVVLFGDVDSGRYTYVEELGAKSDALEEPTITIAAGTGVTDLYVESVSCVELPRAVLTQDATDLGVDVESLRPGQKIFEAANRSYHAVATLIDAAECRRSLLQMHFPTVQVTSGTFVDLWTLDVPVLPRKIGVGDTRAPVSWDVYARATDSGTKGDIKIVSTISAEEDTISVDGGVTTSFAWASSPGAITLACEDLSHATGLPGGTAETVQVEIRRTAGSGTIEVQAVSVWEPA